MANFFFIFILSCVFFNISAQNYFKINDSTFVNLSNDSKIIINSPITNEIIKNGFSGGFYIKTENENVVLNINNNIGVFTIPFSSSLGNTIPFEFNITASGIGSGKVLFNTYETPDNNLPYPAGVTHLLFNWNNNSQMVIDRFWNIEVVGYTQKPIGVYTFTYDDNDIVGNSITESNLFLQRWNSDLSNWGDWLSSPFVNTTTNKVSLAVSAPIVQYKSWTLVDYTQPLPVSLIEFNCDCINNKVLWVTESETNNDKFILEGSDDLINYISMDSVKGAGFSNNVIKYTYQVSDWRFNYIRLKQKDFNGNINIYDPISSCNNKNESDIILYPNPNNGVFTINHNSTYLFSLYDINGKLIFQKNTSETNFNFKHLESGTYFVKLINSNKILNFKLIKK